MMHVMTTSADSNSDTGESNGKSIGVRFAESSIGSPIISVLLFITDSFWLSLTAVGVLITLVALGLWNGVMAGVLGVFGLSGILCGLLGHGTYYLLTYRQDERS